MWNSCLGLQRGEHHCCYMADFFLMGLNDFFSDSLTGFHPGFVGPKAYLILEALGNKNTRYKIRYKSEYLFRMRNHK